MQTVLDQPTAEADGRLRRAADEQGELALLTQFMRHDSVASLANAIAERLGADVRRRGSDRRGGPRLERRRQNAAQAEAIPVNPSRRTSPLGSGASGWPRTHSGPSLQQIVHDEHDNRLSRRIAEPVPLSGDDRGRAGGEDGDRLLRGQYRLGQLRSRTSSATIACCPTPSTPMASAIRSTTKGSSPRCSKAECPIRRASPTLCRIRAGRRSPPPSISSTAAQRSAFVGERRQRRRTSDYVEQQLESDQGDQDVGVQLALYFQRVAPTVTSEYGILADPNLLQVAATIMGLSPVGRRRPAAADALRAHAALRPAGSGQAQAADRAVHRNVRYTYGPGSGATTGLTRRFGQFELGAIGRRRGPLRASSVRTARC